MAKESLFLFSWHFFGKSWQDQSCSFLKRSASVCVLKPLSQYKVRFRTCVYKKGTIQNDFYWCQIHSLDPTFWLEKYIDFLLSVLSLVCFMFCTRQALLCRVKWSLIFFLQETFRFDATFERRPWQVLVLDGGRVSFLPRGREVASGSRRKRKQ